MNGIALIVGLLLSAVPVAWLLFFRRRRARRLASKWLGAVVRREWALARLIELEAEGSGIDVRRMVADTNPPIEPDRRS